MEQESGREAAEVTGTTRERIENARKRLDIAEKWELPTMDQNIFAIVELADEVKKLSDINASLGSMINNKIVEIKGLKSQLAAQKEKYRWRNVDEEEPPRETEVLICCVSRSGAHKYVYTASFDGEDFYDRRGDSPSGEIKYWWPLDLPEMGETK